MLERDGREWGEVGVCPRAERAPRNRRAARLGFVAHSPLEKKLSLAGKDRVPAFRQAALLHLNDRGDRREPIEIQGSAVSGSVSGMSPILGNAPEHSRARQIDNKRRISSELRREAARHP